ncbi:hypothetical protein H0H92_008986 [Tricholoma furcatifolium]|nr:hypothetical protein H0H92_008986 [Tricholoma furcatifolium]
MGIFQKLFGGTDSTTDSPPKDSGPSQVVSDQPGKHSGNLHSDVDSSAKSPAHQQQLRTDQEFRSDDPTAAFHSSRNYKNAEFQPDFGGAGGREGYGGKEPVSGTGPGMTGAPRHGGPVEAEYGTREQLGTGAAGAQAGSQQYRRASDAGPGSGFGGGMGMGSGTGEMAGRQPVKHATMSTPQNSTATGNQYGSGTQQLFQHASTQQRHVQPIIEERDSDFKRNQDDLGMQMDKDKDLNDAGMLQNQNQTEFPGSMGMDYETNVKYAENQAPDRPRNTLEHADPEHVSIDKGETVNERQHHHVHHIVQPVIHKERLTQLSASPAIEPHRIHTTIPIHHVTHEAPVVHRSQAHEPILMEEFLAKGGGVSGMRREQIGETVLLSGECTREVQGGDALGGDQSQLAQPHQHHHGPKDTGNAYGITPEMKNCKIGEGMFMSWETTPSADRSRDLSHAQSSQYGSSHAQSQSSGHPKSSMVDSYAHNRAQQGVQGGGCSGDKYSAPGEGIFTDTRIPSTRMEPSFGRGAQSGYETSSMPPHTHTSGGGSDMFSSPRDGMFEGKDSRGYEARNDMGYGTGKHVDFKHGAVNGGVGDHRDQAMTHNDPKGMDSQTLTQSHGLRGRPEQERESVSGNVKDKMDLKGTGSSVGIPGDSGLTMPGGLDAGNPSSSR